MVRIITYGMYVQNSIFLSFLKNEKIQMDISSSIQHRFYIESPRSKFVDISSIMIMNLRRKDDTDSTWITPNIDEFTTYIFRCRFDVQ